LVPDQGSSESLCIQDYKSLCAVVTICSTLVNIQTARHTRARAHTHTQTAFDQLIW